MGKKFICITIFLFFQFVLTIKIFAIGKLPEEKPLAVSKQTQICVLCHKNVTPGIVEDWKTSRHSKITPGIALKKPLLEKRLSCKEVPESMHSVVVGCYECHSQNASAHNDNFEHFGFQINVIVSPNDCKTCHPVEVEQYSVSKKAHALDNLQKNPLYHKFTEAIPSIKVIEDNAIHQKPASENSKTETCYACHGSKVTVNGMKEITTNNGTIKVPNLMNWPNQGVGRINPDGSHGACTSCHPRHNFSIETARKPYTCSQCHLEPDVPAFNIYMESKHGNIFSSKQHTWNWNNVPWKIGKDFQTPTCAVCHNSLIVTPDNKVVAQRTHDFGARLWVRLFGLIYSHSQPKSGKTYTIINKEGLPLPTAFTGEPATEYLIDNEEQAKRKKEMEQVCRACHNSDWVARHFDNLDATIAETNEMTLNATILIQELWEKGYADPSNPFDELIELVWVKEWFFYANSIRYASAMGGPDYATFKNGWWQLTENLYKLHDYVREISKRP